MYKYCEEYEVIAQDKNLGFTLYNSEKGNNAYIRGFDKNGWDVSLNMKLNYCPMCGRKLGD